MKRPSLAGLSPKAASDVLEHVKIAQDVIMGIWAVCMVEHNLKLSLQWAGRVIVLVGGVVHVSDNPEKYLVQPQELEKFFFGEQITTAP